MKAAKAVTLTDEQMTEYVKEYIDWMDKHNQVCADDDPYTVRLKKLTEGVDRSGRDAAEFQSILCD